MSCGFDALSASHRFSASRVGIEPDGGVEIGQGCPRIAERGPHQGAVVERGRERGVGADRLVEVGQGELKLAARVPDEPATQIGPGGIRVAPDRVAVIVHGLVQRKQAGPSGPPGKAALRDPDPLALNTLGAIDVVDPAQG